MYNIVGFKKINYIRSLEVNTCSIYINNHKNKFITQCIYKIDILINTYVNL